MSRVALLLEVSQCSSMNLPMRGRSLEALQHALSRSPLKVSPIQLLAEADRQTAQDTIWAFFHQRKPDDQVLFVLSGYCVQEADDEFFFLMPQSVADEHNTWIPAAEVRDALNRSPAQRQVVILDCHFRPALTQWANRDAHWERLCESLSGPERVIMTSHTSVLPVNDSEERDVWHYASQMWNYSRYLAEGIETGAVSATENSLVSAAELHHYVTRQLQTAAPGIQTRLLSDPDVARQPFLAVPIDKPALRYRQVVEAYAEDRQVRATAAIPVEARDHLDHLREALGLEIQQAVDIERQVLRPIREGLQRAWLFEEKRSAFEQRIQLSPEQVTQELDSVIHALGLTPDHLGIKTPQALPEAEPHYTERLEDFRQTVARSLRGKSTLSAEDRAALLPVQRGLRLRDADASAVLDEHLLAAATAATAVAPLMSPGDRQTAVAVVEPETSAAVPTLLQSVLGPALEANELTIEQRRIIEHQLTSLQQDPQLSAAEREEVALALTQIQNLPVVEPAPVRVEDSVPVEVTPPVDPDVTRVDRRSRTEVDRPSPAGTGLLPWILSGMMLALLIGGGAALFGAFRNPQQPNVAEAERFRSQGYIRAQQGFNQQAIQDYNQAIRLNPQDAAIFINRGVSHHELGDLNAALNDFNRAIELNPNSAEAFSNRSHVYFDLNQPTNAYSDAQTAVQLDPESLPEAYLNLGNARLAVATNASEPTVQAAAIQDYNRVITATPFRPLLVAGALTNRGNVYLSQNNNQAAFLDYDRATRINPDFPEAFYNRGIFNQKVGNAPAAIADYRRAAELYGKRGQRELQQQANGHADRLQRESG
jgi:tetratricopeptide (TPR) repeat protein